MIEKTIQIYDAREKRPERSGELVAARPLGNSQWQALYYSVKNKAFNSFDHSPPTYAIEVDYWFYLPDLGEEEEND
jgi:hypothetical protein